MDINLLKKQFTDDSIQEKVLELEKEMNQKISSGDRNIGKISSELSYYSELALKISNIKKDILDYENTKEMLQSEQDSDLREMASEELKDLKKKLINLKKISRK